MFSVAEPLHALASLEGALDSATRRGSFAVGTSQTADGATLGLIEARAALGAGRRIHSVAECSRYALARLQVVWICNEVGACQARAKLSRVAGWGALYARHYAVSIPTFGTLAFGHV